MKTGFTIDKKDGGKWYCLSLFNPLLFVFSKSSDGTWKNDRKNIELLPFFYCDYNDYLGELPTVSFIIGPYCFKISWYKS